MWSKASSKHYPNRLSWSSHKRAACDLNIIQTIVGVVVVVVIFIIFILFVYSFLGKTVLRFLSIVGKTTNLWWIYWRYLPVRSSSFPLNRD
jgi:hypothetical protein